MMRGKPAVLAVVFDFDETLVPDSTSLPPQLAATLRVLGERALMWLQ